MQLLNGTLATAPRHVFKAWQFMEARCVLLVFRNGAERWISDVANAEGQGIRFDGAKLPAAHLVEINRDEMGHVLVDKRVNRNIRANPIKAQAWKREHGQPNRPRKQRLSAK